MTTTSLFKSAQIVLKDSILPQGWMRVEDGVIAEIAEGDIKDANAVDLQGDMIFPGLIDLQINGGGGIYFNDCKDEADIQTVLKANLSTGTTGLLATLMTNDDAVLNSKIALLADTRGEKGARLLGMHIEGPFFNPDKKGIHPAQYLSKPCVEKAKNYIASGKGKIKIVTLAPELPEALELIVYLKTQNVIASLGHSNATGEQTTKALAAGATMGTHLYNAMTAIHHHPGKSGMVPALLNSNAAIGLIADGAHVDDEILRMTLRLKGTHFFLVSDALSPLGTDISEFIYNNEKMTVYNGACYNEEGRLAGSATSLFQSVINAHRLGFPLHEMVALASFVPAQILKMEDMIGSLAVKKKADFLIVDKNNLKLKAVYKSGISNMSC